jgi:hypothetical protein
MRKVLEEAKKILKKYGDLKNTYYMHVKISFFACCFMGALAIMYGLFILLYIARQDPYHVIMVRQAIGRMKLPVLVVSFWLVLSAYWYDKAEKDASKKD